jgi:prepilin-type N-terminal cleavage/methylation domain-containing protein
MLHLNRRRGFTLIELLIVVVIIGVLASIAVASFRNVKQKSYLSVLKSDLRNLAVAQEMHFEANRAYTDDLALIRFNPTRGVQFSITATATGWEAIATHNGALPRVCSMFYGNVTPTGPATQEGSPYCE